MSSIEFNDQKARDFMARKTRELDLNKSADALFEDLVREGRSTGAF